MKTVLEYQIEKLAERFLKIKKGEICHINGLTYDITVDQVIHNIDTFANREQSAKNCMVAINYSSVKITEEFGRDRVEDYNLTIDISYTQTSQDMNDYWAYKNHLFQWMYLLMSDSTETVNNFWTQMYSKPSMMSPTLYILRYTLGKSFQAQIKIPSFRVKSKIEEILS